MHIIKALILDTWVSYWHVLLLCMMLGNLRAWVGSKWMTVAFVLLIGFVVISEATAGVDDKDFVYLIGAVIRLIIASLLLSIVIVLGAKARKFFHHDIRTDGRAESA